MARIPPNDKENEEMIIGCMLLYEEAIAEGMEGITGDMFYYHDLAEIYKAIKNLYIKNKGIDMVTVKNELKEAGLLDQVGGLNRLRELVSLVYTSAYMKTYKAKLIENSNRRKAIRYAIQLANSAHDGTYDELLTSIADLPNFGQEKPDKTTDALIQDSVSRMQDRHTEPEKNKIGLLTGLKELDYHIGGLKKQDLIFVTAEPNVGKSIFVHQLCLGTALKKQNAMYFNFEMNEEYIGDRTLAMALPLDTRAIHTPSKYLTQEDYERINATDIDERLKDTLHIYTNVPPTLQTIMSKCKLLQIKGRTPDLIVVDYLQMMDGEGKTQMDKVENLSRGLKGIAKVFACPVIAISSLSKDGYMRHSHQLTFDADVILRMSEVIDALASENDVKRIKMKIEKNRNGRVNGEVELFLSLKYLLFKEKPDEDKNRK